MSVRTGSQRRSPQGGVAILLLLAGCHAAPRADAALLQPRSCWYGVYIDGHKVGCSHSEAGIVAAAGGTVYRRRSRLQMQARAQGQPYVVVTSGEEDYATTSPWLLLRLVATRTQQGSTTTTTAVRHGDRLLVSQRDALGERTHGMPAADFGLRDTLAEALWLATDPPIGAQLAIRSLDTDGLRLSSTTTTLLGRGGMALGAVTVRGFEVERTGASDGSIERDLLGEDGSSLRWQLGSLELRREDREVAMQGQVAVDLARLGTVPADRALGDPRLVRGLEVRIEGAAPGSFADGPGQRVRDDDGVLTLRTDPDLAMPADAREQRRQSAETMRFPCRDRAVVALAQQAVGDAATDPARVRRVCAFVADYIADDAVDCDHASVGEVMQSRRGDCSDHALLCATLLRALGLPARTVAGLVYTGDAQQAFAPHEWCEVVLDGRWLAIDPMWNEVPVNGTHLRLSPTATASPPAGGFTIHVVAQH